MIKHFVLLISLGLVLAGCSGGAGDQVCCSYEGKEKKEDKAAEPAKAIGLQSLRGTYLVAAGQETAEPSGTMEEWGGLSLEEKEQIIQESLEYDKAEQEKNNTPIEAVGEIGEFIEAMDERYEEIQGMDGPEQDRMLSSPIYIQVGIIGHTKQFIHFTNGK